MIRVLDDRLTQQWTDPFTFAPNQPPPPPLSRFPNPFQLSPSIVSQFPAARVRNFFIIHNVGECTNLHLVYNDNSDNIVNLPYLNVLELQHKATSHHYDLRLQCTDAHAHPLTPLCRLCAVVHPPNCSGTLSFSIPLGLSGLIPSTTRLAIETSLHPVPYSFHESRSRRDVGVTGLWDVGTYSIVTSHSRRRRGKDDDADTSQSNASSLLVSGRGKEQEQALLNAYRSRSSFVILLQGQRHRRLLISVTRFKGQDAEHWAPSRVAGGKITLRRQWMIKLTKNELGQYINDEDTNDTICDRSVLTGRTMEEIERDMDDSGAEEEEVTSNRLKEWWAELRVTTCP